MSMSTNPTVPVPSASNGTNNNDNVDCLVVVKTHLWRLLEWMLVNIEPLPKEAEKLEQVGITHSTLQSFSVWRRTMLMLSFPSLFYSALAGLISLASDSLEIFNPLGKILYALPFFAGCFLAGFTVTSFCYWANPRLASRYILIGWMISLILPFIPAFFPIKWIASSEVNMNLEANPDIYAQVTFLFAVQYMVDLVPIIVSIPLGMVRAALRIRGLLPHSVLAGWILMVTLPLKIMIGLLGLVLASQIVGHLLLIVAAVFLLVGPFVYLYNGKLYTEPITDTWEKQAQYRQAIVRITGLVGALFFLIWLLVGELYGRKISGTNQELDIDDPLITYAALVRLAFQFMGQTLVATVCFADLFLQAAIANWGSDLKQRLQASESGQQEQLDDSFAVLKTQLEMQRNNKVQEKEKPQTMTPEVDTENPGDDGAKMFTKEDP